MTTELNIPQSAYDKADLPLVGQAFQLGRQDQVGAESVALIHADRLPPAKLGGAVDDPQLGARPGPGVTHTAGSSRAECRGEG